MNLLLLKPEAIGADGTFTASPEQSEHIACVLRAQAGDRIKTGVLGGKIGNAELTEPSKKAAKLRILSLDKEPPAKKNLRFIIALPRPQSFKKCLHFLAEAGIPEACFIQTARVEKSYWTSASMTDAAIERELMLGLEQGVDTILPKLHFFKSFEALKRSDFCNCNDLKLIAHPAPGAEVCPAQLSEPVLTAIGPEGGFIRSEVEAFQEMGFQCVTLGQNILRVEFALCFTAGRLAMI